MIIKNHFYKLRKELPKANMAYMPFYTVSGAFDSYSSNMYVTSQNGNVVSSYFCQETKRFELGRIYQAYDDAVLYDERGLICLIDDSEIECFEEIDIGMSDVIKRFIYTLLEKKCISIIFTFFSDNIVCVKMSKHTSVGYPVVNVMGSLANINDLIQKAYKTLREKYASDVYSWITTRYKYQQYIKHTWSSTRASDNFFV